MATTSAQAQSQREHDGRRGTSHSRGYNYQWQQAREQYLRENPLCESHRKRGEFVPALVVDHIVPHKLKDARESGDAERIAEAYRLFWSRSNWQGLCKHCHDSDKQRLEKSGRIVGCAADGRPIDPSHPWNRTKT